MLSSEITRNRAEEYGFDLNGEFVIPPYYPNLKMLESEKPNIIEGGRGSGKTMLIRYLSHATQFSEKRGAIPADAYKRIGIYWKMDISFASIMNARGAEDDLWMRAFINMGALILASEIIESLFNICKINAEAKSYIVGIDFSGLKDFDADIPSELDNIGKYLHRKYIRFQSWVSNFKKVDEPLFFPLPFVDELINIIKCQVPLLRDSYYCVYIDEYENLNPTQKKIVNTWLKQSQKPLVFNIAMKHQALDVTDTLSSEKIVEVHDYRKIDLELLLSDNFATFASEIFLMKVNRYLYKVLDEVDYLYSSDNEVISRRIDPKYIESIRKLIEAIFPAITERKVAELILTDETLRNRLLGKLSLDFERLDKNYLLEQVLDIHAPAEALVVLHALLNREKVNADDVVSELKGYCKKQSPRYSEWVHNNLFGCILNFYAGGNRRCPLYSGYDTFVTMSKDNIRHFLELCYTSLSHSDDLNELHKVSLDDQLVAVNYVSKNMLKEIKQFGPHGNMLYIFSMRLGNLFGELRKRESQSEPEQNQFSVKGGMTAECAQILRELVKWSVLYETKLTKQKGLEVGEEYQLNPIYSAFFTISFRKKRRIELTAEDVVKLYKGAEADYKHIIRRMTHRFAKPDQLDLFEK